MIVDLARSAYNNVINFLASNLPTVTVENSMIDSVDKFRELLAFVDIVVDLSVINQYLVFYGFVFVFLIPAAIGLWGFHIVNSVRRI